MATGLAALACAVVVAHGALGLDHMGDGAGVCLAVLVVGGTAAVAAHVANRFTAPEPRPVALPVGPAAGVAAVPVRAQARDGPERLEVFLL